MLKSSSLCALALVLAMVAGCAPHEAADTVAAPASPTTQAMLTPDQAEAKSKCAGRVSPQSGVLRPLSVTTAQGVARFQVEIADTPAEQEFGLMCRKTLAADRGMLFEFTPAQPVQFWMENTLIPLDIVFIGADGRVLNIAANALPLDETALPSVGDAAGVLEIAAGRAAQIGLGPGDQVAHPFFTR